MGQKKYKLKPNNQYFKCPKCGNNTEFILKSSQVAEDCCDIWVECICGFDPTAKDHRERIEDVWGDTGDSGNLLLALDCCWNALI